MCNRIRLPAAEILTMSVENRAGVDALLARLLHHLPEGPKYFPDDEVGTAAGTAALFPVRYVLIYFHSISVLYSA